MQFSSDHNEERKSHPHTPINVIKSQSPMIDNKNGLGASAKLQMMQNY